MISYNKIFKNVILYIIGSIILIYLIYLLLKLNFNKWNFFGVIIIMTCLIYLVRLDWKILFEKRKYNKKEIFNFFENKNLFTVYFSKRNILFRLIMLTPLLIIIIILLTKKFIFLQFGVILIWFSYSLKSISKFIDYYPVIVISKNGLFTRQLGTISWDNVSRIQFSYNESEGETHCYLQIFTSIYKKNDRPADAFYINDLNVSEMDLRRKLSYFSGKKIHRSSLID